MLIHTKLPVATNLVCVAELFKLYNHFGNVYKVKNAKATCFQN